MTKISLNAAWWRHCIIIQLMNEFAGRFERNSAKVRWTTDQLHINFYVVDLHQQNLIYGHCQSILRLIIQKKLKGLALKVHEITLQRNII